MVKKSYPVTRNGIQFEVRAENAEEARKIAEAADLNKVPRLIARQGKTRVFERPNGQRYVVSPGASFTDPKKVEQVLSGMTAGEVSRQSIDEDILSQFPAAARGAEFLRGTPFIGSRLDEAIGAIAGSDAEAAARAASGAMQRQRPGETLGLNLAGGVTTGAVAGLAAPKALGGAASAALGQGGRFSRIARGAATGAALGGVEGGIYGSGEGVTPEERAQEARRGAAIGATAGGILGGATPVASEMAENVIGLFRRSDIDTISKELSISKDAAKVIKNTFDQGGDMQAAISNLQRAGDEAMLADAGPAAQALLDATAAEGGGAGQIVRSSVNERMSRTNEAVNRSLDNALGTPPLGPQTALDEIARKSAPARSEAYGLAYSTPINYASEQGRKIEQVLAKIEPEDIMRAIREANAEMRSLGEVNQQIMASIDDSGNVVYREMPNVRQLDEIKKALQGIAYSSENTNQFGRPTSKGLRYSRLASELRDAVSEAVEPYRAAVSIGGDKISEERAFMLGRDLLKSGTEVEDVRIELGKNPSADQIAAAKSGLRSYISRVMGDVRSIASDPSVDALEARQVIKAVTDMSSDNSRQKIRDLMGKEADALLAKIDEAAQSAVVRAAMAQNSKTAGRLAVKQTVEEITEPGAVGQAMRGEAMNTTKALIQAVTGQTSELTAAQRQRVYMDIARALTEKSGEDARIALRALDAAMKGQGLTDAQTDLLAKLVSSVLTGAASSGITKGVAAERRQAE